MLSFGAGVALGALVRRTGNLGLAFQTTVLFCLVAVLVLSLGWPDLRSRFDTAVEEVAQAVRAGGADDEQVAMIEGLGGMMLLATFSSCSWSGLCCWPIGGHARHRRAALRARVSSARARPLLGGVATLLLALGLVFDAELVQNLLPLAMLAFVVQGFAVVHAWAHAKRWHPALVAPVYILLVTPPTAVVGGARLEYRRLGG